MVPRFFIRLPHEYTCISVYKDGERYKNGKLHFNVNIRYKKIYKTRYKKTNKMKLN